MDSKKRRIVRPLSPSKRTRLAPETGAPPLKAKFVAEVMPRPVPSTRKRPPARARHAAPFEPPAPQQASSAGGQQTRVQGFSDKLQRVVCNGCLWHEDCKGLVTDMPSELPLSFTSAEEYMRTYEPVLQEEARESVRANWAEACEAGNSWSAKISSVEPPSSTPSTGGMIRLELDLLVSSNGRKERPNPKSLVVLTTFNPPRKAALENLNSLLSGTGKGGKKWEGSKGGQEDRMEIEGEEEKEVGIVAGVVGPQNKDRPLCLSVEVFPICPAHEGTPEAPCWKVVKLLQNNKHGWFLVPVGSLVTHMREYGVLQAVRKLCFLKALLKPAQELNVSVDNLPRKWPGEVGKGLHESMKKVYDGPQSDAIAMCTAHFAAGSRPHASQGSDQAEKAIPIMLIQGPPGTGKTHTVRGVLNLWHLVQFQRYYERVIGQFRPVSVQRTSSMGGSGDWADLMNLMKSGEMRTNMKPRILVCAPSNTATDELLERILKEGFFDASGKQYFPNVVRVGAEARVGVDGVPISEGARAVWVEEMVKTWLNMSVAEWERRIKETDAKKRSLTGEIAGLESRMRDDSNMVNDLAGFLIANMEKREKNDIEIERLEIVQEIVCGGHPALIREAKEKLELSYMDHAEMVFTTLSSTGKVVFSKVKRGFKTVLIDEAAQASEVATLQPLIHGCQNCVMVGDPQQLPATVLSQKARELNLERSLFDRLQRAGAPVKVLTIQYRMHPQIRQFPSAYFYNNSLVDGENVLQNQFHEFYNHTLLKPYVLFDVAMGLHERQYSGSLQNHVEAEMAVALFKELRDWLVERMAKLREEGKPPLRSVRVGVITPYKSQRNYIKETFVKCFGRKIADEVKITTVDSFQGKQCDVVILSCVRASSKSSGVGFVADIRRMNVAITRAKKALWILGNVRTLKSNLSWAALIEDAQKRGCIIYDSSARGLFPHQRKFLDPDGKDDAMDVDVPAPGDEQKEEATQKTDWEKNRGKGGKGAPGRRKGVRGRGRNARHGGRREAGGDEDIGAAPTKQGKLTKGKAQDPRRGVIQSAEDSQKSARETDAKKPMQVEAAGTSTVHVVQAKTSHDVTQYPVANLHGQGNLLTSIGLPGQNPTASLAESISAQFTSGNVPKGPHQLTMSDLRTTQINSWKQKGGVATYHKAPDALNWMNDPNQVSALHDAIRRVQQDPPVADALKAIPISEHIQIAVPSQFQAVQWPNQMVQPPGVKNSGLANSQTNSNFPGGGGFMAVQPGQMPGSIVTQPAAYSLSPRGQGGQAGQGIQNMVMWPVQAGAQQGWTVQQQSQQQPQPQPGNQDKSLGAGRGAGRNKGHSRVMRGARGAQDKQDPRFGTGNRKP